MKVIEILKMVVNESSVPHGALNFDLSLVFFKPLFFILHVIFYGLVSGLCLLYVFKPLNTLLITLF